MAWAIPATNRTSLFRAGSHGIITHCARGSGIVQSPLINCPPVISQTVCGGGGPTFMGGANLFCPGNAGSCSNPLKTTASSRRASTLAARRNKASTLVISGSAICAPRTGTLTCNVANWMTGLSWIPNIMFGGRANWISCSLTKSASPGSGPSNGSGKPAGWAESRPPGFRLESQAPDTLRADRYPAN